MNYENMTKAQLIEELRKLKRLNIEKSGEMFFAFVSEDNEFEGRRMRFDDVEEFTDLVKTRKMDPAEYCLDLVYWNSKENSYHSPFGDNNWSHVVRIPNEILKKYLEVIGEV